MAVIPKNANAVQNSSVVDLSMGTSEKIHFLVLTQNRDSTHYNAITEYGVSQVVVYSSGEETFLGVVYREQFAGWEEYGMKWHRFDREGNRTRVCSGYEKENLYTYWKDRKPVFTVEGTIEISKRNTEEGTFETLVQNTELKGYESYKAYVSEYIWETEQTVDVSQWLREYAAYETKNSVSGPELIRKILFAEATESLPQPIYFSTGYNGAAVTEFFMENGVTYFVIKKYGTAHQAGWQSLLIGTLDAEGKIVQCSLYGGDRAQAMFVETDAGTQLIYCTETESTGLLTANGGSMQLENGVFTPVWPLTETGEPDADYWNNRTASIEDGQLKIYEVEYRMNELGMIIDYELKPETE